MTANVGLGATASHFHQNVLKSGGATPIRDNAAVEQGPLRQSGPVVDPCTGGNGSENIPVVSVNDETSVGVITNRYHSGGSVKSSGEIFRHPPTVSHSAVNGNVASPVNCNVVHYDDNLAVLSSLPSQSVDLIYCDPPFFTNKIQVTSSATFDDRWPGGIKEYVDWMRDRVVQMRRVLRSTGSLYLHCDPHASHYLKVMLDGILGGDTFRNEIIWKRTGAHGAAKRYAPVHDVLLYYGASRTVTWNKTFHDYSPEYIATKYSGRDDQGRYRLITLFPPGVVRNGETGRPWRGIDPTAKGLHWRYSPSRLDELDAQGMIYWGARGHGLPQLKRYLDESQGVPVQDVWTDIAPINSQARERLGYPTQKPEALLERIITVSSNEGDAVLDPFCGSGTTLAVAERLGRKWIGIDSSPDAVKLTQDRLSAIEAMLLLTGSR